MISENKDTHWYLKPENSQEDAFGSDLLSSNFNSDIILDLSSFETIDEAIVSSLNHIHQEIVNNGFCMVVAWFLCGFCMVFAWFLHGFLYGFCMVFAWFLFCVCIVFAWFLHCFSMVFVWCLYGV